MCEGIRNSRRITQPVIQTAHCGFAALTPSCSRGDSISPSSSAFWVSIGFIQSCFRRVYPVVFLSDFCRVYPIGFLSGLSRRVSVGLIWSCFSWVYAVVFPSGFCRVYPVVFPLGLPGRVSVGFIPSGFCRVYPVVFPWGLPGRVSVGFLSGLPGRFLWLCFRYPVVFPSGAPAVSPLDASVQARCSSRTPLRSSSISGQPSQVSLRQYLVFTLQLCKYC